MNLAPGWWKFWTGDSWREWSQRRPAWKEYRNEVRRLSGEISKLEASVRTTRASLATAERDLGWAQQVSAREIPFATAKSETGLATVSGVQLLETRRREGKDVWTAVDAGAVHFTDRRAVFVGNKKVEFRFDKLSATSHVQQGLWVAVSSRKRDHILGGPADQLMVVLEASQAVAQGRSPTAAHEEKVADLRRSLVPAEERLARLKEEKAALVAPPRPLSPAWVPSLSIVVVLLALSGGPGTEVTAGDVAAAPTTTIALRTTQESLGERPGTSSTPSTTTQRSTTTTEAGLPAELIAAPAAGPSGDPAAPPPTGAQPVTIVSIADGDTLQVRLPDGTTDTLRLIGVNSPEGGECFYEEATAALASLAPVGGDAAVTADTSDRDQYDRLLRYLWVGGMSVNEELVRRGAAIARRYPPDTAMAERFEQAQTEAAEQQRGMWAPNACGTATEATISIVGLAYDPPGNDNEVLNEEWIRVRNDGNTVVVVTGWGIKDESASHRYTFPDNLTLAPGETATVHTGCGTDFSTDLYWCNQGSAIWNNDGDTAFLLDPNGNIHDTYTYRPASTTTASTTATTAAPTTTLAPTTTAPSGNCDPSYPDVCIPPYPPDLNCGDISYRRFRVTGSDPHGFDRDNDGIGCES